MISKACWLTTAIHEAGHCVCLCHYGFSFHEVEIYVEDGLLYGGVYGSAPYKGREIEYTICLLAGMCAEARHTKRGIAAVFKSKIENVDAKSALQVMGSIGQGSGEEIARLLSPTFALIDRHWPQITRVGAALAKAKYLDHDDVMQLVLAGEG